MQHKHQDGGSSADRSNSPTSSSTTANTTSNSTRSSSPQTQTDSRPTAKQREQEPFFPFQSDPVAQSRGSPILDRGLSNPDGSNSPPPPSSSSGQGSTNSYARSPGKVEEISLRPVRMPAAFRPNIPSMLPKSAQGAPPPMRNPTHPNSTQFEALLQQPTPKPNPMGPTATNLTIKTVPAPEKTKDKKKSMSQEELKISTVSREFGYNKIKIVSLTKGTVTFCLIL